MLYPRPSIDKDSGGFSTPTTGNESPTQYKEPLGQRLPG